MEKKALSYALLVLLILAAGMVFYYKFYRAHRTDEMVLSQKLESTKEQHSEWEGIYSSSEPVEFEGLRLAYINISKKEEGFFSAALKWEKVGSQEPAQFMDCQEVRLVEKEFFVRCSDGRESVSFDGQTQRAESAWSASGKLLWLRDSAVLLEKNIIFSKTTI